MSFLLRPVARASCSARSVARVSGAMVPRRSLHVSLSSRAQELEIPTLTSAILPDEPETVDPTELAQDGHVKLPASIDPTHPYAERRLATANLIRSPDAIDKSSFVQLSNEILLLRGNENFFRHLRSPLLWDTLSSVKTKEEFREFFELLKVWRMEGGPIDWRVGHKILELSLEHKAPLWALKSLMHPTTFGVHLFSPSHPPYPEPTSIEPLSEADAFWMHTTALADTDARDLKAHLRANLPRTNPYIVLPSSVPMVSDVAELKPTSVGVTEPVAARAWSRALLLGDAETDGKDRALTKAEESFVHWVATKFFPNDLVLTAEWLTYLKNQEADEAGRNYNRFLYAQNDLGTVERLVSPAEEDRSVVDALVASAGEWSGKEGEGWPLYARTKALLEGQTIEAVDPELTYGDRTLGYGMGGLVGANGGEQTSVTAEGASAEEKKD